VNHNKGFEAYARSKLALAAVSFRQAEQLAGTGVDVYTVSPGYFIRTNIHRNMRGIWKLGVRLFWPLLQSPERAARTYIYLAGSPEVTGDTGHYWEHLAHKEPSPLVRDKALQARFWDYAVEQTAAPANPAR
jgi:NAD(P)-dependent dehydrogenase (short-subunit alcohol dehydrogenase family)